jgi:hypothetical protein
MRNNQICSREDRTPIGGRSYAEFARPNAVPMKSDESIEAKSIRETSHAFDPNSSPALPRVYTQVFAIFRCSKPWTTIKTKEI